MAEGRLIVEIYEYRKDSPAVPPFAYYPCGLKNCMGRNNRATLREIIESGFNDVDRREQNTEKKREALEKLEETAFGKISVEYRPASAGTDPCVVLSNVMPVSIAYADARRAQGRSCGIILVGRYKLTEGNETTVLRDAQRLTLIYSNYGDDETPDGFEDGGDDAVQKEICLNLTFLE